MRNKRMHTEPQKIICGIEECEYALHFWNCGIKLCKLPFTSTKALKISGGNYAKHNRTNENN